MVPTATFVLALALGLQLGNTDQLFAGSALLVGALLGAFSQVAAWRDRLNARDRAVDGIHLRALDEAAAHILVSVLVSVLAAVSLVVLSSLDLTLVHAHTALALAARILSALGAAAFAYLATTMFIVVNLLWDAYEGSGKRGATSKAPPSSPAPGLGDRKSA